jgi:hypothetical protein
MVVKLVIRPSKLYAFKICRNFNIEFVL